MAGLAQAVGDLFARIAAALAGAGGFGQPAGSVKGYIPQPPPSPVSPPGTVVPPSQPPGTGTPSPPIDRVVDVPTTNLFPAPSPGDTPVECPLFSPSQYLRFVDLQTKAQDAGVTIALPTTIPQGSTQDMGSIGAIGIPVETEDVFRFRAFGSAGAQTVSFFGRVANPQGVITPFNHPVKIDGTGTVFQVTPRPGPGFLLDSAASVPIGSITTGSVNAVGEIGRMVNGTFVPHTLLFAGQISDKLPLSSSLASPSSPVAVPTLLHFESLGATASRKTTTITPTAGRKIRFTRVQYTSTCSAVVGPRAMDIFFAVGGIYTWGAVTGPFMQASQLALIEGNLAGTGVSATDGTVGPRQALSIGLPESMYFYGPVLVDVGFEIALAGDTVENFRVRWEES